MEDLSSLKVVDLKARLKDIGLPVSGTKAVLITRLREGLESQQPEQDTVGEAIEKDVEKPTDQRDTSQKEDGHIYVEPALTETENGASFSPSTVKEGVPSQNQEEIQQPGSLPSEERELPLKESSEPTVIERDGRPLDSPTRLSAIHVEELETDHLKSGFDKSAQQIESNKEPTEKNDSKMEVHESAMEVDQSAKQESIKDVAGKDDSQMAVDEFAQRMGSNKEAAEKDNSKMEVDEQTKEKGSNRKTVVKDNLKMDVDELAKAESTKETEMKGDSDVDGFATQKEFGKEAEVKGYLHVDESANQREINREAENDVSKMDIDKSATDFNKETAIKDDKKMDVDDSASQKESIKEIEERDVPDGAGRKRKRELDEKNDVPPTSQPPTIQPSFKRPRSSSLIFGESQETPLMPEMPTQSAPVAMTTDSIHPPTKALYIHNLTRPLSTPSLHSHLTSLSSAPPLTLHLDSIKTHGFALFSLIEDAIKIRNVMNGRVWPEGQGRREVLSIDYVPEEYLPEWIDREGKMGGRWEVVFLKDSEGAKPELREVVTKTSAIKVLTLDESISGPSPSVAPSVSLLSAKVETAIPTGPKADRTYIGPTPSQQNFSKGDTKVRVVKPDELFRKTTNRPWIYWMEVDPEEVAKRNNYQNDDWINQVQDTSARGNNNEWDRQTARRRSYNRDNYGYRGRR